MSTRTYRDAIEKLNSLQSNAATLDTVRAAGSQRSEFAIPEMIEYLDRIGYSPKDLNRLNVVHVTGTKGKGSTCAFTDSILRHAVPSWKVGLYTSPHLIAVRERIRVNGDPVSEEDFAKFFFDVWDRLEGSASKHLNARRSKPFYFKFVTLVAYHTFLSLGVDATILEVGVGGAYDSTNVVPKPIATGVTSLGLDHVGVLGNTLPKIAWHKGGIYKEGVPAFTVEQPVEALEVLKERAETLKASTFTVLPHLPELANIKLGLKGAHQLQNASLAVHLAQALLLAKSPASDIHHLSSSPFRLSDTFIAGLENARWPGRCQQVVDPRRIPDRSSKTTWFLDGAHTVESLRALGEWHFSPGKRPQPVRILIFNCTSGRSGPVFLETILSTMTSNLARHHNDHVLEFNPAYFDHVIFCTNVTYADGHFKGDLTSLAMSDTEKHTLAPQRELGNEWSKLVPSFPSQNVHVLPSIEHALRIVRGLEEAHTGTDVQVLVAGSLHLVGGVIEVAGLAEVALGSG
ncbi:hypothetical protein BS47DRAFT_1371061 [Hydnum rufescens UP504]|uniref:Folylpolyglutamate synthase n=1 Tax=Hydnum rufescens UP504 TaxID=1448309 RepID=A0A9P6B671_9AGAM|nr:hypothetical protein BS47DRAFT_1371061 [Hydnum rufescens UP504]